MAIAASKVKAVCTASETALVPRQPLARARETQRCANQAICNALSQAGQQMAQSRA